MGDINKMEEECTHNCMTCGHGCAEGSDERITVAGRIRQSIIENDKKSTV